MLLDAPSRDDVSAQLLGQLMQKLVLVLRNLKVPDEFGTQALL